MKGLFKQCELSRVTNVGVESADNCTVERMVSWIPAHVALRGARVRLKGSDMSAWSEGWRVDSVAEPGLAYKYLADRERDYVKQRDGSDI